VFDGKKPKNVRVGAGFSQAEVAARLGISSQQIAEDLKALRSEIRHQRH
jgi:transcriptional regulator with XRE-family HTH domain